VSIFELLISELMASAPSHPLAAKLEAPLLQTPDQPPQSLPGIVKRIIPLDAGSTWEYWWCVPSRLLLPEDVELMQSDRDRVESILEQLVWLFGGHCFSENSTRLGEQLVAKNWHEVQQFALSQGFESYILDIDFLPTAIKRYKQSANLVKDELSTTYIAVEPAHWHVEFLQLVAVEGGFAIQQPKPVCSCQIWTGKPFIKNLATGESSTRYDLWVATPLDITEPPWRE
jgi:hypothetical protein